MTAQLEGLTPGTWNLDPSHTDVSFVARHAGISKVRGTFGDVTGALTVGDSAEELSFQADIAIESVTTGNKDRDNHLRSEDFFAAESFPTMHFASTEVSGDTMKGELTIRDTTRPVELDLSYEGAATDPFGQYRAGFSGETTISRKDFGLTWNAALEAGGVLVSDNIRITIDAEFVAPTAA